MAKSDCGKGISPELISFLVKETTANSIVLFGSNARGDEDEFSDIDLLIVSSSIEDKKKEISCDRGLRSQIPNSLLPKNRWLSVFVYSRNEFENMHTRGSLFVAHVLQEGAVLYDDGFYTRLREKKFRVSKEELHLSLKILSQKMTIADDLVKFNNYYIRCLSNFYLISKNLAIIGSALQGKLVFNKKKAFDELAKVHPFYQNKLNQLLQLKPFYLRNAKGLDVILPFEPYDCPKRVVEIRDDIKQLIAEVAEN